MSSDQRTTAGSATKGKSRKGAARPDYSTLLQGLEQLRGAVRERLDAIEVMAALREAAPAHDASDAEKALRRRIAELEDRQALLVSESKRRENEFRAALDKIEEDRKLLADAWERLERERVDGPAAPAAGHPHAHAHAQIHPYPQARPASPPPVPVAPAFRAAAADSSDVVAHAILKQFQALQGDVRKAAGRRSPR